MSKLNQIERNIEVMENKGFGCVFADLNYKKNIPYERFTNEMLDMVTALYFVYMTDDIFENGLDSLDDIPYIKINF